MPLKLIPPHPGRSPNYRLRGTIRGVRIDETTGTADREAAEAIRIRREAEILDRTIFGTRARHSFAEAALMYMEAPGASERERDLIFPLVEEFGRVQLDQINQDLLDGYIRRRYPGGKPATILRHIITPMSAILNFAARRGWCTPPAFDRPRQPKGRRRWATPDEVAALLAAASPHMRSLVTFLVYTGARVSEALYLDWAEVSLQDRWVVFRDTKNGEDRGVPLHEEAFLVLANLRHRNGRVFLTNRGQPYAEKTTRGGGQTKTAWRAMCARAGIKDLRMHDLRHTFSTWLTVAGVHEQVRDELMGHASTDMGRRYSHVVRPALVKAITKLPRVKSVRAPRSTTEKSKKNKPLSSQ